jgi:hypothetical protein
MGVAFELYFFVPLLGFVCLHALLQLQTLPFVRLHQLKIGLSKVQHHVHGSHAVHLKIRGVDVYGPKDFRRKPFEQRTEPDVGCWKEKREMEEGKGGR